MCLGVQVFCGHGVAKEFGRNLQRRARSSGGGASAPEDHVLGFGRCALHLQVSLANQNCFSSCVDHPQREGGEVLRRVRGRPGVKVPRTYSSAQLLRSSSCQGPCVLSSALPGGPLPLPDFVSTNLSTPATHPQPLADQFHTTRPFLCLLPPPRCALDYLPTPE